MPIVQKQKLTYQQVKNLIKTTLFDDTKSHPMIGEKKRVYGAIKKFSPKI